MENITSKIGGLLTYINEQTNSNFERLGEAVKFLVDNYKSNNKK